MRNWNTLPAFVSQGLARLSGITRFESVHTSGANGYLAHPWCAALTHALTGTYRWCGWLARRQFVLVLRVAAGEEEW